MSAHILVIDDDPIVLSMVEAMLVDLGHHVTTACDGQAGMNLFRAAQPDLVITDIMMPMKDGFETIVEIKRLRPDAKIIAMSGGGTMGRRTLLDIAVALGATQKLRKPFDSFRLSEVVNAVMHA
jgi:CheY-like chemotaxis protein